MLRAVVLAGAMLLITAMVAFAQNESAPAPQWAVVGSEDNTGRPPQATNTNGDGQEGRQWYSLFFDDRSDKFMKLRSERTDLMRRLGDLQAELKELRDKNAVIDSRLLKSRVGAASFEGGYDISGYADSSVDSFSREASLASQMARAKLEMKQRQRRADQAIADRTADIYWLQKLAARTPEQEARLAELRKQQRQDQEERTSNQEADEQRIAELQIMIDAAAKNEALDKQRAADRKSERDKLLVEMQEAFDANVWTINEKQTAIVKIQTRIEQIDTEVIKLIDVGDAEGWFKIIISLVFAALVASVIGGFFWVIRNRSAVIDAIFTNDSGIQFVTIFSIIIAVILFGIIGVLEGRELSALLGGLSGYILGRNAAAPARRSGDGTAGEGGARPAPGEPARQQREATTGSAGPLRHEAAASASADGTA